MFDNYHKWATENNVMNLITQDFSAIDNMTPTTFPHGYYGVTKEGVPIYIERYAKIDIPQMLKVKISTKTSRISRKNNYKVIISIVT